MGISGYTSLSIAQDKYKKIRKDFDKIIRPDTDDTFTAWATSILESNITRMGYLKEIFPNLSVIKVIENGLVIDDLKNDTIVKVTMVNNKIKCSHTGKDADTYILYATMHPEFL